MCNIRQKIYCPACEKNVIKNQQNINYLKEHGKCFDCQKLWQQVWKDGESTRYPQEDWIREVSEKDTVLGYHEWVLHCIERDEH